MNINKVRIWILILMAVGVLAAGFYAGRILLESTPPTLELSGIEDNEIYRGGVTLNITVHDERPGLGSLTVQIDTQPPQPIGLIKDQGDYTFWTLDTTALADGAHIATVIATDRAPKKNATNRQVNFFVDNTPPKLEITPESTTVGQGRTLAIFVQTDEPIAELTGRLFDRPIFFYPIESGTVYRAMAGIAVTHPTKPELLTLKATDRVGNAIEKTFEIKVNKTVFERGGYVKLSPAKQKLMLDTAKRDEDNAKRRQAYRMADEEDQQLWEGQFIRPTVGILTSPFGKFREYNTGVRRHHYGTDISNDVGTPIYAGNHGVVVLSDRLHIYGHAIIINHGQGVSTSYNHLSERHVEIGDRVQKGGLIGLMGATGQVTGPHLHWGMVVNGVAVAPEEWTETDFSLPGRSELE